jgi:hypothetical protein
VYFRKLENGKSGTGSFCILGGGMAETDALISLRLFISIFRLLLSGVFGLG